MARRHSPFTMHGPRTIGEGLHRKAMLVRSILRLLKTKNGFQPVVTVRHHKSDFDIHITICRAFETPSFGLVHLPHGFYGEIKVACRGENSSAAKLKPSY